MQKAQWSEQQLSGFYQAVQSLKLYRRAELYDDTTGQPVIETLYVDPLPNNHVFATLLKPNTTFVVGRKGTGKSTVFQRAQHELRQSRTCLTAYVDIKTVFESAAADPATFGKIANEQCILSKPEFEKLLLYQSFLSAVVGEIRAELTKRVKSSIWDSVRERITGTVEMLFEGLDELLEDAKRPSFENVVGLQSIDRASKHTAATSTRSDTGITAHLGDSPQLEFSAAASNASGADVSKLSKYAEILIRTFNIKGLLQHLDTLLQAIGVKHLYVFVDDFSELPADSMQVAVDALLAPLNNWSNELIKFKIAAYPGRIYYGQIDKTKIDEVYLDTFKLYGSSDVTAMEKKAIDFTRRLVETRIARFCDDAGDITESCG